MTEIERYQAQVWRLAFSADGQYLISASTEWLGDERVYSLVVWDRATWKKHASMSIPGECTALAVSPRDGEIAVATLDDTTIHLVDISLRKKCSLQGHSKFCTSLAYYPDASTLASGSAGGESTVRLWNLTTCDCRRVIQCATHDCLRSVLVLPDNSTILTAGENGPIQLWNSETGNQRASWERHYSSFSRKYIVYQATLTRNGKMLATVGADAQLRIAELPSGKERLCLQIDAPRQTALAFSPDEKSIAVATGVVAQLYDVSTGILVAIAAEGRQAPIETLVFSTDGATLVTGTGNFSGGIEFWDVQTGKKRSPP
jgi:WD40 repeat protein